MIAHVKIYHQCPNFHRMTSFSSAMEYESNDFPDVIHQSVNKDQMETQKKKSFQCQICDFTTTRNENLQLHVSMHCDEKSYHCPTCKFKANDAKNLSRHLLIHGSRDKLFQCDKCEYSTHRRNLLKSHKLRLHSDSSEVLQPQRKKFYCQPCDLAAKNQYNL